jgi:hypothetical protein
MAASEKTFAELSYRDAALKACAGTPQRVVLYQVTACVMPQLLRRRRSGSQPRGLTPGRDANKERVPEGRPSALAIRARPRPCPQLPRRRRNEHGPSAMAGVLPYSVRLNSGVASSSDTIPNANRKNRSLRIATNPPSLIRISFSPCTAYVKGSTIAIARSHGGNASMG